MGLKGSRKASILPLFIKAYEIKNDFMNRFHFLHRFDVRIYFDLYGVCSSSNVGLLEFCNLVLSVDVLATIGLFVRVYIRIYIQNR